MTVISIGEYKPHTACGNDDVELKKRVIFCLQRWTNSQCELEVDVVRGVLYLRGRIASRHDRWLLLGCCRHVAGILRVVDELAIADKDSVPLFSGSAIPGATTPPALVKV